MDAICRVGPKEFVEFQFKAFNEAFKLGAKSDPLKTLKAEVGKSIVHRCPNAGFKTTLVFVCASGFEDNYKGECDVYGKIAVVFLPFDDLEKMVGRENLSF